MRSRAAVAVSSLVAATAATGSPINRTLSRQSACSSWETGRMPNGIGRSCPVRTACTPSSCRAAVVSTETILACGCVLRSSLQYSMRGNDRSSANRVAPVTFATASTLRSALPMTECWTVGMLEGELPSNFPTFPRLRVPIQRFPGGLRDFPPHPRRGQLDRFVDLDVAGAAAEVAGQRVLDLVTGGVRVGGQQGFGRQQKRGGTVAALCGAEIGEGLLQRMQLSVLCHPLDGAHRVSVTRDAEDQARENGCSIQQHGTCAALAQFAAVLRPSKAQVLAQHFEERLVRRERHFRRLPVDAERDLDLGFVAHGQDVI